MKRIVAIALCALLLLVFVWSVTQRTESSAPAETGDDRDLGAATADEPSGRAESIATARAATVPAPSPAAFAERVEPAPPSQDPVPARDPQRERERQEWLEAEAVRARTIASRLGLSAEQTVTFLALKAAHNAARAEVRDILRAQPTLSSPGDVDTLLSERLGPAAVRALNQHSHSIAVHAVLGDERFNAYRALLDGPGDWERQANDPSSDPSAEDSAH